MLSRLFYTPNMKPNTRMSYLSTIAFRSLTTTNLALVFIMVIISPSNSSPVPKLDLLTPKIKDGVYSQTVTVDIPLNVTLHLRCSGNRTMSWSYPNNYYVSPNTKAFNH